MEPTNQISRRQALAAGAAAAPFTIVPRHVLGGPGQTPPSEKLNIAGIGVGGMGSGDVRSVAGGGQNIVALCDPDQRALDNNAKQFPKAKLYADYRKMLETQKDIDAVIVATPDHVHAAVTMMALKMGKHVHCQKPLTHSVYEARTIGQAAARGQGGHADGQLRPGQRRGPADLRDDLVGRDGHGPRGPRAARTASRRSRRGALPGPGTRRPCPP